MSQRSRRGDPFPAHGGRGLPGERTPTLNQKFSAKKIKRPFSKKIFPKGIDIAIFSLYNKAKITEERKGNTKMKANEVVQKIMESDGITQKKLAEALGFNAPQYVGNMLYRKNGMRVDNLVKMLDTMGYEVVVRKKIGKSEEWKVD